jgi:Zn-dependent protease/CBS domain-containing protein
MHASVTLGRPFGIPVGLHWSMLALGALATWSVATSFQAAHPNYPGGTYWTTAVLVVALFGASILGHELAHALVARRHGLRVGRITLWVLGGVAELLDPPRRPGEELKVAAAGPAPSAVFAVAFLGLSFAANALTDAAVLVSGLMWLAVVNGIVTVFNLLPARPLDGGRILTALIWWRTGDQPEATAKAANVGVLVGWGIVGFGVWLLLAGVVGGLWLMLIGWMITAVSRAERTLHLWRRALSNVPVGAVMSPPPATVGEWTDVHTFASRMVGSPIEPFYVVTRFDGSPVGVVVPGDLRRALTTEPDAPVSAFARSLDQFAVARSRDLVARALSGARSTPPVIVVGDDGRVVGQITVNDLARAASQTGGRVQPPVSGRPPSGPATWPAPTGLPRSITPPKR